MMGKTFHTNSQEETARAAMPSDKTDKTGHKRQRRMVHINKGFKQQADMRSTT